MGLSCGECDEQSYEALIVFIVMEGFVPHVMFQGLYRETVDIKPLNPHVTASISQPITHSEHSAQLGKY